ncbi:uncharacterized protein MYCFIDRAFT_36290 [Pseudocercospora fijiensis CIRAD86]|uniref:Inositol-1-monophosphatase n=1 Tax=Pseudocercospora fijiensis (strain CIRAD86) TaxID=383855 RepID=M3AEB3_PSEFD|nr:uncharacterized protein MYCFIDRAFT_36290 [Pseudocercospora fijiensis CIRAD86]EME82916.1 hypothetical protein MYCFIDRAFT_36290 [Pseudocercospora fijiensis CIRAD86]
METDSLRLCDYLVDIVKEAGRIIVSARPSAQSATDKKNSADIVTETDKAVESFIHGCVSKRYPEYSFIGEESYRAGECISDKPTFVVDPIDGTSNFVHGFPEVCVSIGVLVNRMPTVGVVYNPFRRELWTGVKGHGAYVTILDLQHNDSLMARQKLPLNSAPLEGLRLACIGIEFGSDREGPNFDLNLKVFSTLARTIGSGGRFVNSLRCTGSAALAICRVAAGQQEAFWECGCWAWDVAAAWCILQEAGGIMVDGHPGNWDPPIDNRRYLAVRPAVEGQKTFVADFWSVLGDERSTYGPPGSE